MEFLLSILLLVYCCKSKLSKIGYVSLQKVLWSELGNIPVFREPLPPYFQPIFPSPVRIRGSNGAITKAAWAVISRHNPLLALSVFSMFFSNNNVHNKSCNLGWYCGYGGRLAFMRLCVRIMAPDTDWTFYRYIVVKIVIFVWKERK